ncbi:MAG: Aspartyl/glutamyl-tRNA(Asn/Gln) amidotransferase subunit C [Candidatus Gottesmanbacteria bacterium GW2011_GWC2_39_8]|uniref:Aspartyl/glutamyl-tRNA(Asn/Gln) amidotransferase subunit C n=1 Tax=Candidatus Gottesmanbacteria bacterium GW2011_GWC2_39_8 TaxID=1618450 RepID=A0A0G0S7N9_9BACT|nr:MAG: Aspartyl/glutamyl-tRNA(Asn/Gln) amidotransferase subunit C [Candidatus Gottesmanbacteria bacterium GW2011_GWC2_39_8]
MSKTNLTIDEVKHVAKLAKLGLTDQEAEKFKDQLSEILGFVDELKSLDTKGVEPTSQVTGLLNVFREDVVTPSLSQEEALSNAPDKHNGYFKVKAVRE